MKDIGQGIKASHRKVIPKKALSMRLAEAAAPKPNRRRRASAKHSTELNGNAGPNHMNNFACVYILESLAAPGGFYVGLTNDLAARLAKHNADGVPHTAKGRPWRIKTAVPFRDRKKAVAFEKYLKSPSGRAFSKKRL